jgi:nitrate reductase beta subunit
MRYMGVILYDADKIDAYAASDEYSLYHRQLDMILDPHDAEVIAEAERQGISHNYLMAAAKSPVYQLMKEWKIAFPLHPEYRTLPMVWYVPAMSPIKDGEPVADDYFAQVDQMRIPVQYQANLFTAGDVQPIRLALARLLAMREYMRRKTVDGSVSQTDVPSDLTDLQYESMYRLLAIADYEDRFVIPSSPKQTGDRHFEERTGQGFDDEDKRKNIFGGI